MKLLATTVDIRSFLQNQDMLALEQFAIDWIENQIDSANGTLATQQIEIDDNTFRAAIHYEAETVIQVLRRDSACYQFFINLASLTKSLAKGEGEDGNRKED